MIDKKYKWLKCSFETPKGWDSMIEEMCDEVNIYLQNHNLVDEYVVFQVKEKFGSLRWYDNGIVPDKIIEKYEKQSAETCVRCGKPATHMSKAYWIEPLCDDCNKEED